MPIKIQDKIVYPLELSKMKSGGKTVYDRNTRGTSWFFLCLTGISVPADFHTSDGSRFLTSDSIAFKVIL